MKTSEQTDKIYKAIFEVKKKMKAVAKTSNNPFYKSKYADLNAHLEELEPLLEDQGCMLLQPPTIEQDPFRGAVDAIHSRIIHVESSQWVEASMLLETAKPDMQLRGAAATYGRRFTVNGLVTMRAEDDDGNTATGKSETYTKQPPTPKNESVTIQAKSNVETKTPSVSTTNPAPSFRRTTKPVVAKGDDL